MANMRTVRSTYSAAVALPETAIPEQPRQILRRGVTGEEFEFCGWSIRAGDLPLHDRGDDGSPRQCVRIAACAGEGAPGLEISISLGERTVAEARLDPVGDGSAHLLVPEVSSPVEAVLVLKGASGEGLRRPLRIEPQRKWRVFVVQHSHLDIGYTDLQGTVLHHQRTYLDQALDLAAHTDGWPDDARFRWNIESVLPLERWLATRPEAACEELSKRVREGRFEVCALLFGTHTEAVSVDELTWLLRAADDLRDARRYPIVTAMQTDVPGAALGLPAALAAAGVRYLAVAHNWAGRGTPYLTGGLELPRLFYWASPAGERVLVWHTDSPHGIAYLEGNLLGLAESPDLAARLLPEYLAALATRAYPYGQECAALGLPPELDLTRRPYPHDVLHLRVQGLLADNAPPSLVPAEVVRAWNERWTFPQLRLACNADFFAEAEARLGDGLETFTGDWTDWWADGMGSGARANGFNRRAQAEVRTGQTLNVVADTIVGARTGWAAEAERAYESIALFDEHTWGAAHPGEDEFDGRRSGALQWQSKAALAVSALDRSRSLVERGAARIAAHVAAATDAVASVLVVNESSSARTDAVRLLLPEHRFGNGTNLALRDEATGAELPIALEPGPSGSNRPQGRVLSFVAGDVPPLGFRRYAIVAGDGGVEPLPGGESSLENEHYMVEFDLDDGCVTRLFDRELALDLVDAGSPFGFGQYVYDRYTGSLSGTLRLPEGGARPTAGGTPSLDGRAFLESRALGGQATVLERATTQVEDRVRLRLVGEGATGLEVTFRLVRGVRRLDVEYRLEKTSSTLKEGVYFAFPFALEQPEVLFEMTGGVDRPQSRVPGSARHVQVVRHWAALGNPNASIALGTLEASLLEVGTIYLPYPPYRATVEESRAGTLVAWAMNNVWDTNFALSQAGETRFCFAVASAAGDPRQLGMRTAAALARPLVGIVGAARPASRLAAAQGSFCTVDHPEVEVVMLTASRRGHDFVAMVHSLAANEIDVRVEFPAFDVGRVWLGTSLERDERDVTDRAGARVRLRPGDYVSLAVDLQAA